MAAKRKRPPNKAPDPPRAAGELERFNKIAVGRESKMIELKKEVNSLLEELGRRKRYPLSFEDGEQKAE